MLRRTGTVLLLITFFAVYVLCSTSIIHPVRAGTVIVPDDYLTIQEAVDHANVGDTVFVRAGLYSEPVTVRKTLWLAGENRETTVLNGTTIDPMVIVEADNVKISGFTLEGWSFNNIIINGTTGAVIFDNKIAFNAMGILVENSTNTTIEKNVIEGFGLDNIGIMLDYSSECRITNNTITNGVYDGVRLRFSDHNLITRNVISENDYGIYLDESKENTISENAVSENGNVGINFEVSCSNNTVVHNNFVNNYGHVRFWDSQTNVWDDASTGNYWSNITFVDLFIGPHQNLTGSDGIGDSPYVIDEKNSDRYPLMKPWMPVATVGDINHDGSVNILDIVSIASIYGCREGELGWNPKADLAPPYDLINMPDLVTAARHYGEAHP